MSDAAAQNGLFGLPLSLPRSQALELAVSLNVLWVRQMPTAPGTLEGDLDQLSLYFDPLARGLRLRPLLDALPDLGVFLSPLLRPPLTVGAANDVLITAEGRIAMAVIESCLANNPGSVEISEHEVRAAEHIAYERHRRWSIQKIERVLELRAGNAPSLVLPSIALLLLLLVNGSTSPETSLQKELAEGTDQSRINAAIARIINSFCDHLEPGARGDRHFALYGGYALSEARRRLSGALGPETDKAYVRPEGERRVIQSIASELRRPLRSPSTAAVLEAFDLLVMTYRDELPALAALNLAHERRTETRRLRTQLEEALGTDYLHP